MLSSRNAWLRLKCYLVSMKNILSRPFSLRLLVCYFLCLPISQGGEILDSYINYENGHYQIRLQMKIEAETETVYAILTDFNHLKDLNPTIKTSRLVHSEGKQHKVQIIAEGCVWFFCQEIMQVQQITELGNGYIQGVTLPKESNMEYGRVLWHIQPQDEFTVIQYRADVVPGFFVPPLIGPYFMKRRMLEEAEKTIHEIERIAQLEESY